MAENTSLDKPPSPFEIIMSCSICQKLISDIYRHPETNSLRDGTDNLIITKLWLTECAHLTCSQHLEGGGPPFHREGEQPKAPCPMCTAERGDRKPKRLYGIRGKADDEHDEAIPGNWFQTPPMDLGPGMEAFRVHTSSDHGWGDLCLICLQQFQYLSLIKYGTMITRRFREALNSREQYKVQLINVTNDRASLEQEMNGLKLRVKDLEETEAKWLRYKKREPSVTHYLSIVSDIAKLVLVEVTYSQY
ncbi:hypothetical protein M501DRAFT_1001657 [Patellaria atrata CBS 101060]|uniref:Uncharacterized protein n=1 Tax=Patellaria atrata CBS 101060 TaxID=1346257 RepID=A0A9P4VT84_9PEZI|nr:hypothetical protein M501DRAFT_1001657 [Patellaria atrata CBS 101060]